MQENAHVHKLDTEIPYGIDHKRQQENVSIPVGPNDGKLPKSYQRKGKRSGVRHGAISRPFARVRSGAPTGTTPHFRAWMADLDVARVLHGIKLDNLADQLEGRLASTFAILRVSGGYRTVLQLSKADVRDLLRIPSIGIKSLELVEDYLNSRRVRLAWTAK